MDAFHYQLLQSIEKSVQGNGARVRVVVENIESAINAVDALNEQGHLSTVDYADGACDADGEDPREMQLWGNDAEGRSWHIQLVLSLEM
jgi:hypothetical protein